MPRQALRAIAVPCYISLVKFQECDYCNKKALVFESDQSPTSVYSLLLKCCMIAKLCSTNLFQSVKYFVVRF